MHAAVLDAQYAAGARRRFLAVGNDYQRLSGVTTHVNIGSLDSDGTLRVTGRADEVIVSGGENVASSRVEAMLEENPRVRSAMVVGIPSEEWGMEVGCLYASEVSPREIEAWAKERLPGFMVPRRWLAVDEIPKTSLGKPDRSVGRSLLEAAY